MDRGFGTKRDSHPVRPLVSQLSDLDGFGGRTRRTALVNHGVQKLLNNGLFARVVGVGSSDALFPFGHRTRH